MSEVNKAVYKAALKLIEKGTDDLIFNSGITYNVSELGVCTILSWLITGSSYKYYSERFPEWDLQRPTGELTDGCWWDIRNRKARIKALKKAIKLC